MMIINLYMSMFKICLKKEHSSVWQKCHNVDWTGLGLGLTGMVSSNNMRQKKIFKNLLLVIQISYI